MKRMAQRVRSMSRLVRVLVAFGLAVAGGALLLIPANAGASAATDRLSASVSPGLSQDLQTTSSSGQAFDGTAAVGALFTESDGKLGTHFCTASVVQSTHGDLAVTAAHCVTGVQGQIVFVPGYANGKEPYGGWQVTAIYTNQAWKSAQNPDDDFAFLRLADSISGKPVEDVTGAERLGISWQVPALVRVIGYPDSADQPIACTNWANKFSSTQLVFDCAGYTDGTSGGPFLTDVSAASDDGTVIGVIGGYEQGGNLPQVSYAAAFGPATKALFQTAEAAG
jgi:V8-like Glu-specific endopeptidase